MHSMQLLDFNDPRTKANVNKIEHTIWISRRPTQTRQQSKKRKKYEEISKLEEDYAISYEYAKQKINQAFKGKEPIRG